MLSSGSMVFNCGYEKPPQLPDIQEVCISGESI